MYRGFSDFVNSLKDIFAYSREDRYKVKELSSNDINKIFNTLLLESNNEVSFEITLDFEGDSNSDEREW
mgnify:CR=1 FL=1